MRRSQDSNPTPIAPPLSPAEQAHLATLQTLLTTLQTAEADPSTTPADRGDLLRQISVVTDQIDATAAGAYSRNTVDIQATEDTLGSPVDQLKQLQADLHKIGSRIKTAAQIESAVESAITTAQSLFA